jgi:hypothetical protein
VSLVRLWMGGAGLGVAAAEYGMAKGPFYRASGSEIWAFVDSNGVSKHRLRKVRKTGGGGREWGGAVSVEEGRRCGSHFTLHRGGGLRARRTLVTDGDGGWLEQLEEEDAQVNWAGWATWADWLFADEEI